MSYHKEIEMAPLFQISKLTCLVHCRVISYKKFIISQNYHHNIKTLFDLRVWKGVSKTHGSLLGGVNDRAKSDLHCMLSLLNLPCSIFTVGQKLKGILPASAPSDLTRPPAWRGPITSEESGSSVVLKRQCDPALLSLLFPFKTELHSCLQWRCALA